MRTRTPRYGTHRPWATRDHRLVRRAAGRAALQAAALVAVTFALAGGLVYAIVVRGQDQATETRLTSALRTVDDVTDPPDGVWLVLRSATGGVRVSGGAPSVVPDRVDLAAVSSGRVTGPVTRDLRDRHGVTFRVRTARLGRSGSVAQAALSLSAAQDEQSRLAVALEIGGVVALTAAAAAGAVTGRRAVTGLVQTASRQRQFVADAGHELRTPLTVLTTRTQLLGRHLQVAQVDSADRVRLLGDCEGLVQDSRRLAELLEELLMSVEPGAEESTSVDLHRVAADVVASMRPLADDRDVVLAVTTASPGTPEPVVVSGGAAALGRCVTALVDNATRHSPRRGTVTIGVGSDRRTGSISVTDSGPGISPALQPRLFDRFAHSAENADHGRLTAGAGGVAGDVGRRHGLGLAVVADTTHRLGGRVDVDTSDRGTTFTIRLPRSRPDRPPGRLR